jgi:cell division protein FtsQ
MAATRFTRPAAAAAPVVLPGDVRLMNVVASSLFALPRWRWWRPACCGWRARPGSRSGIQVEGELLRITGETLRANAAPRLAATSSAPTWPRRARLRVRALGAPRQRAPHLARPAGGAARGTPRRRAVAGRRARRPPRQHQGEVFAANVGDVEDEALPAFSGPDGSAAPVLAMYRRCCRCCARATWTSSSCTCPAAAPGACCWTTAPRWSWAAAARTRCDRTHAAFRAHAAAVTGRYRAPLEYADLRHADGYAVRLRGVTTTPTAPPGAKPAL